MRSSARRALCSVSNETSVCALQSRVVALALICIEIAATTRLAKQNASDFLFFVLHPRENGPGLYVERPQVAMRFLTLRIIRLERAHLLPQKKTTFRRISAEATGPPVGLEQENILFLGG